MSSTESSESGIGPLLDDARVVGAPASRLTEQFASEPELIEFFREGNDLSEIDGVGSQTSNRLWDWFDDERPDVLRERKDGDEAYCTEFTTDHGIPEDEIDDDRPRWAFICPRCSETNPLVGDPEDFRNKPFACVNCRWVPLLDGQAIDDWLDSEPFEGGA